MKQRFVSMSQQEASLGWLYLTAELFVLPWGLQSIVSLLPVPISWASLNFLYFLLNFLAIFAIFRRYLLRSLLAARKQPWQFIRCSAGTLALYFLASWLVGCVCAWASPGFSNVNDGAILSMASKDFPLVAFGTVLLVPTAEEVLYRGLVFGQLSRKNPFAAWALSIALFSAIHVVNYIGEYPPLTLALCFLQYLPAGLCLNLAYASSGTIVSPILIHTIINAIGIFAMR